MPRNIVQEFTKLAETAYSQAGATPDKAEYYLTRGRVFRLAAEVSRFPLETPVVLSHVTEFTSSFLDRPGAEEALGIVQDAIASLL